jgi:uncharacterized protein YggE
MDANSTSNQISINKSLIYKIIIAGLLVIMAIMLGLWHPWSSGADQGRTVSVSGEAKLKAAPDQYVFNPIYEFKNEDKSKALAEQTDKNNQIIAKLKELGVKDADIKNNASGYSNSYSVEPASPEQTTYSLSLTITVSDKDLATKVQDYLVSTNPEGQVTPQAGFSEAKRKELENQARDMATKDARTKAEQIAKNTGAKLGKVKSIQDGGGFGQPITALYEDSVASSSSATKQSMQIQPGENELNYAVSVSYYLK